jgi:hypothetical protein
MTLGSYDLVLQHLNFLGNNYTIKDLTIMNLLKSLDCSSYHRIFELYLMDIDMFCEKYKLKKQTFKRFLRDSKKFHIRQSSFNKIKSITNFTTFKKSILVEFILNKPTFRLKRNHFTSIFLTRKDQTNEKFLIHPMMNFEVDYLQSKNQFMKCYKLF